MSDNVSIPRPVWENLLKKVDAIGKMIEPLAKNYKAPKWLTGQEVMGLLQVKEDRLAQIRAANVIRLQRFGRRIEYYREDIEDYKRGIITLPKKAKEKAD